MSRARNGMMPSPPNFPKDFFLDPFLVYECVLQLSHIGEFPRFLFIVDFLFNFIVVRVHFVWFQLFQIY